MKLSRLILNREVLVGIIFFIYLSIITSSVNTLRKSDATPIKIPLKLRPVPNYGRLPSIKGGLCPQNEIEKANFKNFRYYNVTQHCHRIDEQEPCNRHMQFYRIGTSDFGDCDCRYDRRCGRPLVYWKKTDSCFYINTKGPCQDGYWIVYGLNKKPVCQRNPCLAHEELSPSNHRHRQFWFTMNGKCYKTRTLGYCPNPEEVYFFRDGEGYPACIPMEKSHVCHTAIKMSRPCWAGQKFDILGNCRNTIGLWGSEDDH